MERILINPKIWIQTGVVLMYGSNLDADYHSHVAIQVIWPKTNSSCQLNNKDIDGLAIIDSTVKHCLNMVEGWILLIEPTSLLGAHLKELLNGHDTLYMGNPYEGFINESISKTDALKQLLPLCTKLNIAPDLLDKNEHAITDQRIGNLLIELRTSFQNNNLIPESWKASDVARRLYLSESRFLHLFSEQVGIPWRPFLLWKRMMCALTNILSGLNATEAAHTAGFSDGSHLSRTFKNTFGMTIQQAKKLAK